MNNNAGNNANNNKNANNTNNAQALEALALKIEKNPEFFGQNGKDFPTTLEQVNRVNCWMDSNGCTKQVVYHNVFLALTDSALKWLDFMANTKEQITLGPCSNLHLLQNLLLKVMINCSLRA
jgi:hypothetical protein